MSSYFFVNFFSIEAQEVTINTDGETITETYYDNLLQQGLTIGIFIRMLFFYGHLQYIIPYLTSRKFIKDTIGLIDILLVVYTLENFILYLLYNTWPIPGTNRIFIFIYTFYGLTSLGYGLYNAWKASEKSKLELKQQVVSHELEALKSQFDPHFVFNTLNSLLYIAEKEGSTKISTAIEEMSSLMRSVIYDFREQTIPLIKEIELLKKYINLQKLKYDENDEVEVLLEVDPGVINLNPQIAPLILLPFIENAFKHGIDIYSTSFIHILIRDVGNEIEFIVENSNHSANDKYLNGIGMELIKKRMQWLYPGHHRLEIDPGNPYIIKLKFNPHYTPSTIT